MHPCFEPIPHMTDWRAIGARITLTEGSQEEPMTAPILENAAQNEFPPPPPHGRPAALHVKCKDGGRDVVAPCIAHARKAGPYLVAPCINPDAVMRQQHATNRVNVKPLAHLSTKHLGQDEILHAHALAVHG